MSRKIKRTPTSTVSVKVAFEEFVVAQTAKGFAVSTIQNYHSHFHSISKHIDIETPFCELGQTDIEGMIVSMRESGLATNSISSYIRVFKTFMNWSQQQGYTSLTVPNYKQVETAKDPYAHASDMLPHKAIAHIPGNVDYAQKQIKDLLERVLDMDASKRSVASRLYDYYKDPYHVDPRPFEFQPLTVSFEMIDRNAYAEVLYPKSIYDLIDFYLRELVRREQKMRVCKNCGKYFAITGRTNAEYCDRVFDSKGRTRKDVGAIAKWTREKDTDDVFKAYRREYKKQFAWTKSGKILPEELYAWGERAREKKAECDSGKISLEEYVDWLKES